MYRTTKVEIDFWAWLWDRWKGYTASSYDLIVERDEARRKYSKGTTYDSKNKNQNGRLVRTLAKVERAKEPSGFGSLRVNTIQVLLYLRWGNLLKPMVFELNYGIVLKPRYHKNMSRILWYRYKSRSRSTVLNRSRRCTLIHTIGRGLWLKDHQRP